MGQAEQAPAARARIRGKQPRSNPTPKAGRNLPAATVVGLAMLFAVLGGLLFLPLGFVAVTTTFAIFGVWEIFRALEANGTRMPIVPVMTGTVAMPFAAYFGGTGEPAVCHAAELRGRAAVAVHRKCRRLGQQHLRRASSPWAGCRSSSASPSCRCTPRAARPPLGLWPGGTIPPGRLAGGGDAAAGGLQRHLRLPGGGVAGQAPHGARKSAPRNPGKDSPAPSPGPC